MDTALELQIGANQDLETVGPRFALRLDTGFVARRNCNIQTFDIKLDTIRERIFY